MIIIITGKAGAGKTTLRKLLLEKLTNFSRCVSYTTRMPRMDEKDGVDYCFISKKDFFEKDNIFLKRKENGNFYGVDKDSFQNKNIITILDLNGIAEIIKFLPQDDIRLVYLHVPQQVLIERLTKRGEALDVILKRLNKDVDISENAIKQTFPKVSLLTVNNTQLLKDSLDEIVCFITKPRVLIHQNTHGNYPNQEQKIKN